MFRSCSKIKMDIGSSYDRSPHWTMFNNSALDENNVCQLTSIAYLFYGCTGMGPFRLYGNHVGEYDGAHQGLFTPLVNCTDFTQVFGGDSNSQAEFICDLNAFKLADGQTYGGESTISITNFRPKDVYVDLNKMTRTQARTAILSPGDTSISSFTRGILKGFFDSFYRLPNSLSYILSGLRRLNFGSDSNAIESETFSRIPLNVTSLKPLF